MAQRAAGELIFVIRPIFVQSIESAGKPPCIHRRLFIQK